MPMAKMPNRKPYATDNMVLAVLTVLISVLQVYARHIYPYADDAEGYVRTCRIRPGHDASIFYYPLTGLSSPFFAEINRLYPMEVFKL
jgi:hypothetical protein